MGGVKMNASMRKGFFVSVTVVLILVMLPLTALANHVTAYDGTASCEGFELHAEIAGVVTLYWTATLYRWDGANWIQQDFHTNGPLGEQAYGPTWDHQGQWSPGLPDGEYWAVLQIWASDGSSDTFEEPGITLPCSPPTAVTLAGFDAAAAGEAIVLNWETAAELNSLGFNVYRAASVDGVRSKLNSSLIASQAPGSPTGASYQFADDTARAGITYYYWLQEVDANGGTVEYGPVSAQLEVRARIQLVRPRLAPTAAFSLSSQ
jgi:hypothetical protein